MTTSFFDCDTNEFVNTIKAARFIVDQIDASDDMCDDAYFRYVRANIERALKWYEYRRDILIDVMQNDDESQAIELFENYQLNVEAVAQAINDEIDDRTLEGIANLKRQRDD